MELLLAFESIIWGPAMLICLGGAGLYLTLGLRFVQFRRLGHAFGEMLRGRGRDEEIGDITPFNSLMTAISGTVGTGNIVGVATAIFIGGPGALFYMWVIALFGMATKYSECMLGAEYREKTPEGLYAGGPMYYIKNGFGGNFGKILGGIVAVILVVAALGIGNSVQSNSLASTMQEAFGLPPLVTGIVLAIAVGLVIIGGIKRIGEVAGKIVPFMIVIYVIAGMIVILTNISEVGNAFVTIVSSAFTGSAALGGFTGATVMMAIQFGVARGVFSNESGLGSASIAHAAAQTKNPVRQAHIAMLGTFIDTIIICSITGLAIVVTQSYGLGINGAPLTIAAFSHTFGGLGAHIVNIVLLFFVFTTIIAWYFYGERGLNYLGVNKNIITGYKTVWLSLVVLSASADLALVWTLSSAVLGLLVYPNVLALMVLSPKIFNKTKEYWQQN
ncbi:MAG: sodium:alanine symporter family protein [Alphaproteobacteria bacterium]|nr:sodium:alanine symporter family protein [Alphaproteobacteria bacterium]